MLLLIISVHCVLPTKPQPPNKNSISPWELLFPNLRRDTERHRETKRDTEATMEFDVEGVHVFFPYRFVYPEQYVYMAALKRALSAPGHALLEMPSGTGKTIALFSLILAFRRTVPSSPRLIYCTRTISEMEKALEELKRFRDKVPSTSGALGLKNFVGIGLASRKNLCIFDKVLDEGNDGDSVDARCRCAISEWAPIEDLCPFYQAEKDAPLEFPEGGVVHTLEDLREFGKKKGICPYFFARRALSVVDVCVMSYQYVVDPKVSGVIEQCFNEDGHTIVVFDEAHNIDSVCIQALSIHVDDNLLRGAEDNLKALNERVSEFKKECDDRLEEEHRRLVDGLILSGIGEESLLSLPPNPVLPVDIPQNEENRVPGNIRYTHRFLKYLRRLVWALSKNLPEDPHRESVSSFVGRLRKEYFVESDELRFSSDRLRSSLYTLKEYDVDRFKQVALLCEFASLIGTYDRGFTMIFDRKPDPSPSDRSPGVISLCCLDASIAMKPVFQRYKSVILTSGTLSPLHMYEKLLKFSPAVSEAFPMSTRDHCVLPLIVSRGSDQVAVTSKHDLRGNPSVLRNYGDLVLEVCRNVPDGVICFFPSYAYMADMVKMWFQEDILKSIQTTKLVMVETPDAEETSIALDNFREACDCGRGAVFFAISRGKIAEGIDFSGHYGRAVIMIGIPYVNTESHIVQARSEFFERETDLKIKPNEFWVFDALRQASQCIGRVLRNKLDYGIMILADHRYNRRAARSKIPKWIRGKMREEHLKMSTNSAIFECKRFLSKMATPASHDLHIGETLWDVRHVEEYKRKTMEKEKDSSAGYYMDVEKTHSK
eukprot:TRINITY_DN694_c0_g1_i1.p1 TRINITY_DN694_c0_g1~~TRINITY_DN694_c0_g1_i1.p1  ORF type:complete len:827 (-),score=217.16 TRINITY_DN694_c0_g1_i1:74-2554(-)